MAGGVKILLLGELAVVRAGRPAALPASKKTRALAGYLALSGRPHTREELCDTLWQGPDDPRAALRWSLSKLRGVLGAQAIEADRDRIALRNVGTDLASVRDALRPGLAAVDTETLRRLAGMFRGELLEGLTLPDCYRFHEWSTSQRDAARSLRVTLLAALVDRTEEREQALQWARQRASIDPLSEAAHIAVIRLLGELGRKRDALAQYETCRRILDQELSASPTPALLEAKMRLGGAGIPASTPEVGRGGEAPASQGSPDPSPVAREAPDTAPAERGAPVPPFVGRAAELEVIARIVQAAARAEEVRAPIFLGEPGIGKSRLLDQLASAVLSMGGLVLSGRAFEAEMVRPYGPWTDALRGVPPALVPAELRAELGGLLPTAGAASAAANRASLFDAVVRLLVHLSEVAKGPVAVVLDDLHWFDEATAALLHYVVRAVGRARIVFACAARPGELSDNLAALRLVRALCRDGRATTVDVGPLEPVALASLVGALASTDLAHRVARDCAGNPLFALELARAIGRGDGAGDSIGGLIAERLARLDEPARELLAWAAALGASFDLATLERVTGAPPLELDGRIAQLERHGIVRASRDGAGYDFVHDLVRAGAYRQLSEPRRRGVHRNIARMLQAQGDPDGSRAGDIVHHAALGGDAELVTHAAVAGAERCLRMFAGAEAARLVEAGMQHVSSLPRARRVPVEIALLRALVFSGQGRGRADRLKGDLARAVIEAQDAGLYAEAAQGLNALSVLQFDRGDLGGARESALRALGAGRAAVSTRDADPRAQASQLGDMVRCFAMLERDMDQAHTMYAEARVLADRAGTPVLSVEWAGAMLSVFAGDAAGAVSSLRVALGLARAAKDRWSEYECLRHLVTLELEETGASGADHVRELLDVASRMGEGSERPVAEALEALGRLRRAEPGSEGAVEQAIVTLRDVDAKGMLAYTLTFSAERDLEAGRLDEGQRRAEEALRAAGVVNRRSQMALARVVLARAALARGDRATARDHVDAMQADFAAPLVLSARARAAVARVAGAVDGSDGP